MSSDGCQEVAWAGQAFPYLLHHPSDPSKTHSYAEKRHTAVAEREPSQTNSSDVRARAAAGTWNGAAPSGFLPPEQHGTRVEPSKPSVQQPEPRHTILGSSKIPLLGFGTWQVGGEAVKLALEAGFRHFDCATEYNNEDQVGEALKDFIQAGRREELFITSKVWNDAHRPDAVKAGCKKSIENIGCSYLDLYLIHWPNAWKPGTQDPDNEVTLAQTWAAMEALVDEGLVKQIGVSNFSLAQVETLLGSCRIKPVCNQVELHPLLAQRKLVGTLFRQGVQCVAYSPLGGSDKKGTVLREHPKVLELAKQAGRTPSQIILKWNIQRGVPVLVKASSMEHLKENLDLFDWKLDPYQKVTMDGLDQSQRLLHPSWAKFDDVESGGVTKPSLALGDGKHYD